MKRIVCMVVTFVVIVVNLIMWISTMNGRTNIFSLYKDVTIQHEIYQKINSGSSYDELIKFIDDKKINYSLKDNKLNIDLMSFDISNKENIKLEDSKMIESFKKIDEKSSETRIKVSYNKDGERKEVIDTNKVKYDGVNYFWFDDIRLIIYAASTIIILAIIVVILALKISSKIVTHNYKK